MQCMPFVEAVVWLIRIVPMRDPQACMKGEGYEAILHLTSLGRQDKSPARDRCESSLQVLRSVLTSHFYYYPECG